jgi:hypothetical protein
MISLYTPECGAVFFRARTYGLFLQNVFQSGSGGLHTLCSGDVAINPRAGRQLFPIALKLYEP